MQLRGADLRSIRERARELLPKLGNSTTLVVTVERGVNDGELGAIIDHALEQPSVRGVTIQSVKQAGRVQGFVPLNIASRSRKCHSASSSRPASSAQRT